MRSVKVFAPATVANVGCGFDILGFALSDLGDELVVSKNDTGTMIIEPGIGCEGLPTDPAKNVVTVAASALLGHLNIPDQGYTFHVNKLVKPGSGLGSSASSAAAAVVAMDNLLNSKLSKTDLVRFAAEGEKAASLKTHYDNVAPSIFGGFTLVRDSDPLDVIPLTYPGNLTAVIAHPQVEVKTADAKKILKPDVALSKSHQTMGERCGISSRVTKRRL